MAKANRKATTTDIAVELTRRSTMAALFASAALCGPASAATVCPDDPIFMLIEEHKAARAAFSAALADLDDLEDGALFRRSPRVQLGVTKDATLTIGDWTANVPGGPFYASSREAIEQHFAAHDLARTENLHERRDALLAEWDRQEAANVNPALEAAKAKSERAGDAEQEATVVLLTTPPTTLAGAVALLSYLAENNTDGEAFNVHCGNAGDSFSALVDSLSVVLASLVHQ